MERPEDEGGLRRSAAGWFRAHGYPASHRVFLAADQPAEAFDVVAEEGQQFFERGESATLARWLSVIEQSSRGAPASVGVNLLAAQVAAGESVAGAETYRRLGRRSDVLPGERAVADALYACLGLDDLSPEEVLKAAGSAVELLGVVDRSEVADFIGIGGRIRSRPWPSSWLRWPTSTRGTSRPGVSGSTMPGRCPAPSTWSGRSTCSAPSA